MNETIILDQNGKPDKTLYKVKIAHQKKVTSLPKNNFEGVPTPIVKNIQAEYNINDFFAHYKPNQPNGGSIHSIESIILLSALLLMMPPRRKTVSGNAEENSEKASKNTLNSTIKMLIFSGLIAGAGFMLQPKLAESYDEAPKVVGIFVVGVFALMCFISIGILIQSWHIVKDNERLIQNEEFKDKRRRQIRISFILNLIWITFATLATLYLLQNDYSVF